MLILNRKEGQSVIVTTEDGEIEFSILEISGKYAKVGVKAPPTVLVDRKEVSEERRANSRIAQDKNNSKIAQKEKNDGK